MKTDLTIELESKVSKTIADTITISKFRDKISFKLNNPDREFSLTNGDLIFMINYITMLLQ